MCSILPSLFPPVPHGIAGAYAEIYALRWRWLCQQQSFILGRNCVLARSLSLVPPPFLRPPTFSLLPSSSSLAAPPPPSLNAQKGYDIILEWALRYIALFPPSFLSISPSAALLPQGDLLTDDWGTTFVHYMTSIPSSRTLS